MKKTDTAATPLQLTPEALRFAAELMAMEGRSNAGGWYDLFGEILDGGKLREWLGEYGYRGPLKADMVRRLLKIGAQTYGITHQELYVRYDD